MAAPVDEVFLDEPWVTIRWDSTSNCVHTEWKAFANSAEFRASLMKAIQAIKERKVTAYISDTRKIKVVVHEDQKWVNDVWVPLAVAAGLKRFALVTAASGLGKVTVEEAVHLVHNTSLLMRTVDSVGAARKWIREGS